MYVNVVGRVREEFGTEEVARLDCTHVGMSDCKRIGVKLKVWVLLVLFVRFFSVRLVLMMWLKLQDLVPCVPILFKDEQIILWRGKKN